MKKISIAVIGCFAILAIIFGSAAKHNGQTTNAAAGDAVPEAAIVFLIDYSGSMLQSDVTRMKNACISMVDAFPSDMNIYFGVVRFSTNATVVLTLSNNRNTVKGAINSMPSTSTGNTNLYDGFLKAEQVLANYTGNGPKNIILMTDGVPNTPTNWNSVTVPEATKIKNSGTTIFGIGFGSANQTYINSISSPGKGYYSTNSSYLNTIVDDIVNSIMNSIVMVTFVEWDRTTNVTVYKGTAATAPTPSEQPGYTFTGWDRSFSNVTAALTVTAQYKINTFTVTFVDWDGTVLKTQTVNYKSFAAAPAVSEREGYTFTGWDNEFSNVTANLTVTALYEINTYTVNFVDWNGELLEVQIVDHFGAAETPTEPERAGYTFIGWDVEFDNVTENLTVTAMYEANTFLVSVEPSAYVNKLNGNKNELVITVTEIYSDESTVVFTESFMINNNAADIYNVGPYRVYVDTKGNDHVRECYIVSFVNFTDGLNYTLINNDTEYAVSIGSATAANIIIPSTHKGLPVTAIAEKGFRDTAITGVIIPNSVTALGRYAFYNCTGLTKVTIPGSVKTIGDNQRLCIL